jgi:zinc-ribbon domain
LITCPTCGRPVPEGQRFCGNCGTDVQAASSYRAAPTSAPPSQPPGLGANAYGYETGTYDYAQAGGRRPSTTMLLLIVAAIVLLCSCCAFASGAAAMYWLGPVPTPAVPTPTPQSLLLLFYI